MSRRRRPPARDGQRQPLRCGRSRRPASARATSGGLVVYTCRGRRILTGNRRAREVAIICVALGGTDPLRGKRSCGLGHGAATVARRLRLLRTPS